MSNKLTILVFAICFVGLCASEGSRQSSNVRNSLSKIVPRLLWNLHRGEESHKSSPPVIIVQQPSDSGSDRHHHQPYPFQYNYPPQFYRPPPPQIPPFNIPGLDLGSLGNGLGTTILVINPNNMQNLSLSTSTGNSTSRSFKGPSIGDLLQGLNLGDFTDSFDDDSEVVNTSDDGDVEVAINNHHDDNQDQDDQGAISDDELSLLERQASRGLSPKQLLTFLMQDKRRRRMQEVLAGIYLRNYSLNRK
ncbi:uncharacterized protein [Drosophila tropicalis]|uniref:uncharacterized protein n=1 Tax=Drosophila tropicalis TaxID=46794 RepID=UPI0035AC1432